MAELRDRAAFEAEFERQIGKLTADQRRRLAELLGDPPDPANVPEEFWHQIEQERREKLAVLLLLLFLAGARLHGAGKAAATAGGEAEPSGGLTNRETLAAAEGWSEARAAELARDYVAFSREQLAKKAVEWEQRRIAAETGQGGAAPGANRLPGPADAKAAAGEIFSMTRDENLAITETTAAGSSGGEWAVNSLGLASPDDLWRTETDERVCTICAPLDGRKRAAWQDKFPQGPPCHPRCRCWIEYAKSLKGAAAT